MPNDALYIANTDFLTDEKMFSDCYGVASEERRKKINSLKNHKDKCLSLCAEMLLKRALSDDCKKTDDLVYGYNTFGKPHLKKYPDFHFSLSHSGNFAVCAVSDGEVGCDIEKTGSANLKIAERFFSKEEYENIISGNDTADKNDLFFRYWTLKESYVKAIGTGIKTPLFEFCILINDRISVSANGKTEDCSFSEVEDISGHKCAFCKKGQIGEVKLYKINF